MKQFYIMAEVKGSVAVLIDAKTKKEALERLRNGSWDDSYDVSLITVGTVHCESAPVQSWANPDR